MEQYQKNPQLVKNVSMHRKAKGTAELACWVNSFAMATEYHGEKLLETTYY